MVDPIHNTFLPHGVCFLWRADLVWLHALSDAVIALAYLAIPLLLWLSLRVSAPVVLSELVTTGRWFIAFILLCAGTHGMGLLTIWYPYYYAAGFLKVATASVSVGAAINLAVVVTRITRAVNATLDATTKARLFEAVYTALHRHRTAE